MIINSNEMSFFDTLSHKKAISENTTGVKQKRSHDQTLDCRRLGILSAEVEYS